MEPAVIGGSTDAASTAVTQRLRRNGARRIGGSDVAGLSTSGRELDAAAMEPAVSAGATARPRHAHPPAMQPQWSPPLSAGATAGPDALAVAW